MKQAELQMLAAKKTDKKKVGEFLLSYALYIILLLILVVVSIIKPSFISITNILNILKQASTKGILGLGCAGLIVLAGTDLSIGRVLGFSAAVTASLVQQVTYASAYFPGVSEQFPLLVPLIASIIICVIFSLINGFGVAHLKMHAFIITLGTQLIAFGANCLYIEGQASGSAQALSTFNKDFLNIAAGNLVFTIHDSAFYITSSTTNFLFRISIPVFTVFAVLLAAILVIRSIRPLMHRLGSRIRWLNRAILALIAVFAIILTLQSLGTQKLINSVSSDIVTRAEALIQPTADKMETAKTELDALAAQRSASKEKTKPYEDRITVLEKEIASFETQISEYKKEIFILRGYSKDGVIYPFNYAHSEITLLGQDDKGELAYKIDLPLWLLGVLVLIIAVWAVFNLNESVVSKPGTRKKGNLLFLAVIAVTVLAFAGINLLGSDTPNADVQSQIDIRNGSIEACKTEITALENQISEEKSELAPYTAEYTAVNAAWKSKNDEYMKLSADNKVYADVIASLSVKEGAEPISISAFTTKTGSLAESGDYGVSVLKLPLVVLYFILLAMIMWVVWNRTKLGKNMFAVGGNSEAAAVSGVNVAKTIMLVYLVAGILYGVASFLEAARIQSVGSGSGINYELDAISACVIGGVSFSGGVGTIGGVVLGAIILQAINYSLYFLGVNAYWQYIIRGLIIVLAVAIDVRKYLVKK